MKKIMIVTGHGQFATALQSTFELLLGPTDVLHFVDFTAADTDKSLKECFKRILAANEDRQVLFVCDILGGTPFKVAAELALHDANREVVAGVNVGSIIEAIYQDEEMPVQALADAVIRASKKATVKFEKAAISHKCSGCENGI
ncbi:hypothetical protein P22_1204 [Propionispora sp. 2/2-37]|uniref:PTS sugar transporter subunit IIA domain-containing protein n=1 Tax=Propionispora sp. 2/2-37 TaxID=1677858 RepID=UPI0006BB8252|nr:hypothetical protein [Propionispora sp. 2/2-37]CUH95135.1 hypothetical protein P22_1204 [Propionispora sp. 2/2-37]